MATAGSGDARANTSRITGFGVTSFLAGAPVVDLDSENIADVTAESIPSNSDLLYFLPKSTTGAPERKEVTPKPVIRLVFALASPEPAVAIRLGAEVKCHE